MYPLEKSGILNPKNVYYNLNAPELYEEALKRDEGILMENGALLLNTSPYTGRSPNDRFTIEVGKAKELVSWGGANKAASLEVYNKVFNKIKKYLENKDVFVCDAFAGADKNNRIKVRCINELAAQNLVMRTMLIRPESEEELAGYVPDFTLICAPGVKCVPEEDGTYSEAAILVNFEEKTVLIAGSKYAGEMKKGIFYVMNYILPQQDVFPMHCSANVGKDGDVALFFGLSGTGKTTLSADTNRSLIGDDEHGWSSNGIFNFEGGCYAKCIKLSEETEPEIYRAIKFGSIAENIVVDKNRVPDYDDASITENSRVAYPLSYIPNALIPSVAGHPKTVIFLTADAFGVLPPVAKLTKEAAMYHFVSGYTSKLAGTERGITEPSPTFSTCFGGPFLPLHPSIYAEQLGKKIEQFNSNVYLINTGWSGGPYGVGKRMSIKVTRAIVTAALTGQLEKSEFVLDPIFNILVPKTCPNVPSEILIPKNTWADKEAYEKQAKKLAGNFIKNFETKYSHMPQNIIDAGPKA